MRKWKQAEGTGRAGVEAGVDLEGDQQKKLAAIRRTSGPEREEEGGELQI